jgi:two-component system, LytTR family, sensor kinase
VAEQTDPTPALQRTFGEGVPVRAVFLLWWTGLALLFGWQRVAMCACEGEPILWGRALLEGFVYSYSWAVIGLVALLLAARFPPERYGWRRRLPLHLALALPLITGRNALVLSVSGRLFLPEGALHLGALLGELPAALFVYLLLLRGAYAWQYFRRAQDRKLDLALLEARLAAARVDLLAVRLQPEFIFGVLRRTGALARQDGEAAGRLLARLGELLRLMLSNRDRPEIPLGEEVRALRLYLGIEQALAGGELEVGWSVDPGVLDTVVPRMILQPVVERMVRQAGAVAGPGRVDLRVARVCDGIAVEARCRSAARGAAFPVAEALAGGPVVSALRARLDGHYGEAHRCMVRSEADGEVVVSILVPLRPGPGSRAAEPVASAPTAGVGT